MNEDVLNTTRPKHRHRWRDWVGMMRRPWLPALVLFVAFALPAAAQQPSTDGRPQPADEHGQTRAEASSGVLRLLPPDSVTEHTTETRSGKLAYTATAGTFSLYDKSGEKSAKVFYTAYVAKGANRPLTFVFNGGPGAASAYLHLGLVGPRIIDFGKDHADGVTPHLRDNPETWLAFTDLVLVDPIGTGWSRTAKSDNAKKFWGVKADADIMAKVIALYIAKNGRTASPKYLLGESYGGFRAVKVARAVQREQGIVIGGIIMISPMLEGHFQFGGNFALSAALRLPSLAAAELERRKAFTPEALAAAEHFALTDYLTTLAGPPPQGETAKRFYARVAELSGLPVDVVKRTRGFIHDAYIKNLHSRNKKIVSPYDATQVAFDPFPERTGARGPDPILDGFVRALGSAFVGYARDELGYKTEMTYTLLASEIDEKWDWGPRPTLPSVTDDLRLLLALNPSFYLLVMHGLSGMVTPFAVSRYVIEHLPTDLAARAKLILYRGGHMVYLDDDSRRTMTTDARQFYRQE
jgi:carboxypeptidase C (cathepsin A)